MSGRSELLLCLCDDGSSAAAVLITIVIIIRTAAHDFPFLEHAGRTGTGRERIIAVLGGNSLMMMREGGKIREGKRRKRSSFNI